jgi:hypothetical protein
MPCCDDPKIKNWRTLLQNIAAGLNKHNQTNLGCLEVVFFENNPLTDLDEEIVKTGVQTALDWIANDIYWNEEADWSNATHAEVRSL